MKEQEYADRIKRIQEELEAQKRKEEEISSAVVADQEFRAQYVKFITAFLSEQESFGPAVRVTIDWSGAFRIVTLQVLVAIAAGIIYGIANSGP